MKTEREEDRERAWLAALAARWLDLWTREESRRPLAPPEQDRDDGSP